MTEFILISADSLTEQSKAWLQVSLDKTPNSEMNLDEIIQRSNAGEGNFYIVRSDKDIGCVYVEWLDWCLNVVLLGGDNIKPWRNDFHDFCVRLMRERKIDTCIFIGRYGLGKLFPQFKSIGMMFVMKDGEY